MPKLNVRWEVYINLQKWFHHVHFSTSVSLRCVANFIKANSAYLATYRDFTATGSGQVVTLVTANFLPLWLYGDILTPSTARRNDLVSHAGFQAVRKPTKTGIVFGNTWIMNMPIILFDFRARFAKRTSERGLNSDNTFAPTRRRSPSIVPLVGGVSLTKDTWKVTR